MGFRVLEVRLQAPGSGRRAPKPTPPAPPQVVAKLRNPLTPSPLLLLPPHQVVAEAEAAGVKLQAPAFNSLLVCAGRSGQLGRAFEVLDMMADRGVRPDAMTYGSLVEACVMASRQELALKIFHNALREVNRSGIGGGGGGGRAEVVWWQVA